jgi:hypothetical protein
MSTEDLFCSNHSNRCKLGTFTYLKDYTILVTLRQPLTHPSQPQIIPVTKTATLIKHVFRGQRNPTSSKGHTSL